MILAFVVGLIITYYTYTPLGPQSLQTSVSENSVLDKCTPDHELNHIKRSLFNLYWIASRWAGTFVLNDSLSGEFPSSLPFDHRLIEHHVQTCTRVSVHFVPERGGGRGGGYSWEFLVGVCRPVLQIHTPFQIKKLNFPHPFSEQTSKIHIL